MLQLSNAFGSRILPGLCEDAPRPRGVRTWIETGSYYIDQSSDTNALRLKNLALAELLSYLSYDFERFALSSLECFLHSGAEKQRPRALSWPLLRMYYAGFFGAHAIMRAVGQGVFRVEGKQARHLTEIAHLYSDQLDVGAGTYEFKVIQNTDRTIDLALKKLDDFGGAHDQFWRNFFRFLQEVGDQVSAAREPNSTLIISEVLQIQSLLAANGLTSGTWLSSVRNQINYQHEYDVWFPYGESFMSISSSRQKLTGPIRLDFNANKNPLQAFDACCRVVAVVSGEVSELLCRRKAVRRYRQLWHRLNAGN